MGQKIKPAFQL